MQWFYSANGQQQGPVSQSVLESLAQAGTITAETLVWREGMANWAPYSSISGGGTQSLLPAVATAGTVATGAQTPCSECGRLFSKDDLVAYEGAYVCGGCKAVFFQKVREGVQIGGGGLWRYKKQLVSGLNPVLPNRCVKCNAPTETPQVKRNLMWHHPAVYLALLVNLIVYVIAALIARKRTTAMVSVCPEHRVKRRNANESGPLAIVGAVAFLFGLIYGIVKGRLIYAAKIDKERVWMGGCGKDFLAQFPEWTGG